MGRREGGKEEKKQSKRKKGSGKQVKGDRKKQGGGARGGAGQDREEEEEEPECWDYKCVPPLPSSVGGVLYEKNTQWPLHAMVLTRLGKRSAERKEQRGSSQAGVCWVLLENCWGWVGRRNQLDSQRQELPTLAVLTAVASNHTCRGR